MCGIAGFFHPNANFLSNDNYYKNILHSMNQKQAHRGPDDDGVMLTKRCGFAHRRLSIIDLKTGHQPLTKSFGEHFFTIIFNGELYNYKELRHELISLNSSFETASDTEVVLECYLKFGPEFIEKLDGIFSFAIYNSRHETVHLYRDPFGTKPLFYTFIDDTLVFSSEIKSLFSFPGIKAEVSLDGLNEIFRLGPARTPGNAVFVNIKEIVSGHFLTYNRSGFTVQEYYKLHSRPHRDDYKTTIEKTKDYLYKAVKRQMVSDVNICTFLSGGIDSSIVSSIMANELKKEGKQLDTFSFDFTDNANYFEPSTFQCSQDRPYVDKMVTYLNANHHYLECGTQEQADLLIDSVKAHDLPCMADIDSSLLYFCKQVSKSHKVVLTGECADEIFGGYPWFHKNEFFLAKTFPWTPDLSPRKKLLSSDLLEALHMDEYVENAYYQTLKEVEILPEENDVETSRRGISYLNIRYFMQTLLNRMDRTSMASGLEARVPFADKTLLNYVYNVPWEMKAKGGLVKNLLRQASVSLLPEDILFRAKSPYPKTYNPAYENLLTQRLKEELTPQSPLYPLLNQKELHMFLNNAKDYGKPWYGQLMAGPQMLAYLLQVHYWLNEYKITIHL